MTASKFTEHLDSYPAYSHRNVSLDDILAETRIRSFSSSSRTSSEKPLSSPVGSETIKEKLRRLTIGSRTRK